ncbi:hypothetical protein FNF31_01377 [Cafeteria roenbergensis]|uniref:Helicase ATP-binding domain-containing protein n=1 Tax=Cafeteria roenbergensis TaxID=33653 RepID=A0A5A8DN83_CAFRO|nr:hypothetical protein FNF31_01377 [Cafeteria roenbergensis]
MAEPEGGFPFPFEPYDVQRQLMRAMWEAIETRKVGVFESPTGTGKTLSIICSALHWLKSHESDDSSYGWSDIPGFADELQAPEPDPAEAAQPARADAHDADAGDAPEPGVPSATGRGLSSPTRRWLARSKRPRAASPTPCAPASKLPAPAWLQEAGRSAQADRLVAAQRACRTAPTDGVVGEEEEDEEEALLLDAGDDAGGGSGSGGGGGGGGGDGAVGEASRLAALLRAERDGAARGGAAGGVDALPAAGLRPAGAWVRQLVFASRTHSQVTQFLGELGRTSVGEAVRAVHVGGRQQLCVNDAVRALGTDSAMADRCLQLRDRARRGTRAAKGGASGCSGAGCPFAGAEAVDRLGERLLAARGGVDVEEAAALGRRHGACPYYAVRKALPLADVVALPYTSLLSESARGAVGIGLRGAVVVVDEAHNLAAAAGQANGAVLTGLTLLHACRQAEEYLRRYRSRLRGRNVIQLVLAGGTMPPLEEMRQQLFPSLPPARITSFACGHVVGGEALCGAVMPAGPAGRRLDLSMRGRGGPGGSLAMADLGEALLRIARFAPAGMAVFLPSYAVEDSLLGPRGVWTASGLAERLGKVKRVFREPRGAEDLDAVLRDYGEAAAKGAVMFAVMGGKLSEGLNFSDGLARTVVVAGLPYANAADPELQERMARADARHGAGAGRRLYESLCMQAVNQAIGRAVRHKGDWAATVLADARFGTDRVRSRLPDWLQPHVRPHDSFAACEAALREFFAAHGHSA